MGRYREIPCRINLGHTVGSVNTSDWWLGARGHDVTTLVLNDDPVSEAIILVRSVPCPMTRQ
jgi:hypothetical protein